MGMTRSVAFKLAATSLQKSVTSLHAICLYFAFGPFQMLQKKIQITNFYNTRA